MCRGDDATGWCFSLWQKKSISKILWNFIMYIKKVVIEGFKSYREQVATENFSENVNCVVGANGSGKSNFFHAIRFVISDLFHTLRSEEKQALLHEGAGHQVKSVFVEILFNNPDNHFPIEEDLNRISENSAEMYDSVSEAHEKSKELDKILKDMMKESLILNREKEI